MGSAATSIMTGHHSEALWIEVSASHYVPQSLRPETKPSRRLPANEKQSRNGWAIFTYLPIPTYVRTYLIICSLGLPKTADYTYVVVCWAILRTKRSPFFLGAVVSSLRSTYCKKQALPRRFGRYFAFLDEGLIKSTCS